MNACDEYIEMAEKELPDIVTTKDLIKIGMYRSDQAASVARRKGKCPGYFQFNKRVVIYPKKGVIDYLKTVKSHHD